MLFVHRLACLLITLSATTAFAAPRQIELADFESAPKFEWVQKEGPLRSLVFEGPAFGEHASTQVFAYYSTPGTLAGDPSLDKNLPAIVLLHGGGGTAFWQWTTMWANRGYAAICIDQAGERPVPGKEERIKLDRGGPGQGHDTKFHTLDGPVTGHWGYHAIGNAILSHSLIRSFPEVDPDRTAVTGISWGGWLTCIVASIDNRFKAAVPVYGCGFLDENSTWLGEFANIGPERTRKWVYLYDPSSYLPRCEVPIFFVNGTNDFAYPLDAWMKSYYAVPVTTPKAMQMEVGMLHSHHHGWQPPTIQKFVDRILAGGKPPVVKLAGELGKAATVKVEGLDVVEASVHWTTGTNPINKREWESRTLKNPKATKSEAGLAFDAPPAETTAWFVSVKGADGSTYTSESLNLK